MATQPLSIVSSEPLSQGQGLSVVSSQPIQPPGEVERFARGFNKAVTGAEDPAELWKNLKAEAAQIDKEGGPSADPSPILKSIHEGMQNVWNRATEEFKAGNLTSAHGLLNYLNSAVHAVESGVPVAGPALAQADQQAGQGNIAGAAGTITGTAAPLVMGARGANMAADTGTLNGQAVAAPSTMKGVAAKVARGASDVVDPEITGIVSPRLAHVQRVLGKVADNLEEKPAAAPTGTPLPSSPPPGSQPVPAAQYFAARKAGASDAQARVMSQVAHEDAQKAALPAVNDVIDQIVPPAANKGLNLQTKAKVDFYVQKGNVDAAKEAIQSAATTAKPAASKFADVQDDAAIQQQMRQDLGQQYARGRLVESRQFRSGSSADKTKISGQEAQGESGAQRVSNLPLPDADIEANRMLGYDPHGLPQAVKPNVPGAEAQPWGGLTDGDLTAILQESVKLAKKGKRAQTK